MKGLFLKDAYMIWKYCRGILFITLVFFVGQNFINDADSFSFFYIAYPAIFYGMIPVQTLFYDEKFKWHTYSTTLPVTRRQVVSSKYLLTLFCACVMTIVALVVRLLYAIFFFVYSGDRFLYYFCPDTLPLIFLLPMVILLFSVGVELPILFKMGTEKGRMLYQILNGVLCGGVVALQFSNNAITRTIASEGLADTPSILSTGSLLFLLFISIAVFVLSWFFSVRFYEQREL